MDRVITVFMSYREADQAERAAMAAVPPQERLDQALALQARYREALGDAADAEFLERS